MFKRSVVVLLLVLVGAIAAQAVRAQFVNPQDATGTINTAIATSDLLHICQPSGATTNPICPIDTAGADETIYAANEDLVPGSVRWQKIRVSNVGTETWDILGMTPNWTGISDPSGQCDKVPEGVVFDNFIQVQANPLQQPSSRTDSGSTATYLFDAAGNFASYVAAGDLVYIFPPYSAEYQLRTIVSVGQNQLNVTPNWTSIPTDNTPYVILRTPSPNVGPGVTVLGKVGGSKAEPLDGVSYDQANDNHASTGGSSTFRRLSGDGLSSTVHIVPGDYEDLLLGIRLPIGTPDNCLNVVWGLTTTWNVQVHTP